MTTEIENTRHQMYTDLKRFQSMVGSTHLFKTFQDSLEAHLEELRKANCGLVEGFAQQHADIGVRLANMTEERDQIQQRLHAIDHAYNEQSNRVSIMDKMIDNLQVANKAAGEELIRAQSMARQYGEDCRSAEKHSDRFSEQLRDAQSVIANQEQLIVGQRLAIADLYLAGRRVNSAVATLQSLGYTDGGGQLWKPPLGKKPHFDDWCTDPRCAHCRARAGGPGTCSVAIVSNGAGYPGSGAGAVNHGVGAAGVRPGVGAGGSGSGGGAGRATGR